MHRKISRRDFMDGMAVAVGGAVAAGALSGCSAGSYGGIHNKVVTPPDGWTYAGAGNKSYPPAMTGLRGSVNPALRVPHELRDGIYWAGSKPVEDTGERYDLIVVGAGISGLSAAHFFKQRKPDAKILILDNHDDFGGHARRNEFRPNGNLLVGYGGSQSIEGPSVWSPQAKKLLADLGVQLQKFDRYYNQNFNKQWKLNDSEFFTRDLFSGDHLAVMQDDTQTARTLANAPMSAESKAAFLTLQDKPGDYLPGMSDEQKKLKLVDLTYRQYLRDYAKMPEEVLNYLQTYTSDEWGFGIDAFGAIDAWAEDYPGFGGLKLNRSKEPYKYCGPTIQIQWNEDDPYIYHFPDGNNGICKLLIGQLIPNTGAPQNMDAEPLARIDYSKLDVAGNDVRLRLSSPCVRVQHKGGDIDAGEVEVDFDRDGKVCRARASNVVMACYNTMIPYLMQDLPSDQKQNLFYGTKLPVVYAMVQLRNWEAWERLRIYHTRFTSGDWVVAELDYPVSFPGYQFSKDPSQPILVHMIRMATAPGDNPRGGVGPGRRDLFARPFSSFERTIRDQLTRLLSGGGFDPAKDIQAITVNRWGHGYALEYGRPWAPFWPDGPLPSVLGRTPFGRVTIANSDSQNRAYADAAIDAAWRAVSELG
ncbi:NAD(P)/FAD-dependent oxidoreductase [Actinomadura gamaensis]|uniref:NAD(P)-binding protein n=1 Tax=Actinomadura gamaensis TaxID=1763541 RepID=A0ABV9TQF8_9ACTN